VDILRTHKPDRSASAFLVERYLSASAAEDLAASVGRVGRVRAVNDAGQFPLDRIAEAVLMITNEVPRRTP
jgi:hypothetical protein